MRRQTLMGRNDGMTEGRNDGMTEGRTKQTLNAPLPFYGGGIKTRMVEQLGREVCNIWYYVARKKTRRGSKQYCICNLKLKKKDVGGLCLKS